MAYTPVRLYQGQPGTTDTSLYSAAGNVIVKQIVVCNTDSASQWVSVYLVPNPGTTAAVTNAILFQAGVAGNSTVTFDVSLVMVVSDALRGIQQTASKVTLSIHGVTF